MSAVGDHTDDDGGGGGHDGRTRRTAAREAAARRRRLAEVFGDVLPDTTSDERDPDATGGAGESSRDRWFRDQVPPHHG